MDSGAGGSSAALSEVNANTLRMLVGLMRLSSISTRKKARDDNSFLAMNVQYVLNSFVVSFVSTEYLFFRQIFPHIENSSPSSGAK